MREATLILSAAIDASLSAHDDDDDVQGGDSTHVLGVDVEWKPVRKMGEREVVQIMQIATTSHVIILDIPALLQEAQEQSAGDALPSLLSVLADALACQGLIKLGFQVRTFECAISRIACDVIDRQGLAPILRWQVRDDMKKINKAPLTECVTLSNSTTLVTVVAGA